MTRESDACTECDESSSTSSLLTRGQSERKGSASNTAGFRRRSVLVGTQTLRRSSLGNTRATRKHSRNSPEPSACSLFEDPSGLASLSASNLGWAPQVAGQRRKAVASASAKDGRHQVARYDIFDFLLGDVRGQFVLLAGVALLLILLGSACWILSGGSEGTASVGVMQALWMSWGLFFDPGTQTAIPASESAPAKAVAVFFSICGFIFNLVLLGLIVDRVRFRLRMWRRTRGKIVRNDHVVLLGWTDRTLFLCSELCEMASGDMTIVILGEIHEDKMYDELRLTFPHWHECWPNVSVVCMQGKPFEVDDLMRVSVYSASVVIALATSRQPRRSDYNAITTVLALCAVRGGISGTLISELRLMQSIPIVRALGGRSAIPIVATTFIDLVLAYCIHNPVVGSAVLTLMSSSSGGGDIMAIEAQALFLEYDTFGDIRRHFSKALLLGIAAPMPGRTVTRGTLTKAASAGSVAKAIAARKHQQEQLQSVPMIAPPDNTPVGPKELLLFLAEDSLDLVESSAAGSSARGSTASNTKMEAATHHGDSMMTSMMMLRSTKKILPGGGGDDDDNATDDDARRNVSANQQQTLIAPVRPQRVSASFLDNQMQEQGKRLDIIVVGWQRSTANVLRELDLCVAAGSEAHALSRKDVSRRERELADTLVNITVRQYAGYPTDINDLERLPVADANCALVAADIDDEVAGTGGSDLQVGDSCVYTTCFLLRTLAPRLRIIAEFLDVLTMRLLTQQSTILESLRVVADPDAKRREHRVYCGYASPPCDGEHPCKDDQRKTIRRPEKGPAILPFHRNFLETAALSVSANGLCCWDALQALVGVHKTRFKSELQAVPCETYIAEAELVDEITVASLALGARLSFNDLAERVRADPPDGPASLINATTPPRTAMLVGWLRKQLHRDDGAEGQLLNPPNKKQGLLWTRADLLFVLRGNCAHPLHDEKT